MSEDDTIRDSSESGYVATRPRYTRARRTWKANWRYLTLEDVRSLEHFRDDIVKRGALPFYFPSILKNGSFEIAPTPGTGDIADGWQARADVAIGAVSLSPKAFDGNVSVQFASTAGQVVGGSGMQNACIGGVQFVTREPVAGPGDTLGFGFWYFVTATTQSLYFEIRADLLCDDGNEYDAAAAIVVGASLSSAWKQLFGKLVLPAVPAGVSVKEIRIVVSADIVGFSTKPTLNAGEVSVLLDSLGVAVIATAQRQALMVGSTPITRQVRFTKLPEFADLGWVGGVKRYGMTAEFTEL